MQILITDVTEMGASKYCVAGWCQASNAMIRPLPNGGNWPAGLLNGKGVAPGVTLDATPSNQPLHGVYPHRTEDTAIDPVSAQVIHPGPTNWWGPGAPPTAATLNAAFAGNVQHSSVWNGRHQGVYVPENTNTRSLWGLQLQRQQLQLVHEDKLKAYLNDGQHTYVLSVSSRLLKEAFRAGGLPAANAVLPNNGLLHVRVGLARAFSAAYYPDRCYVMVNGVHW